MFRKLLFLVADEIEEQGHHVGGVEGLGTHGFQLLNNVRMSGTILVGHINEERDLNAGIV